MPVVVAYLGERVGQESGRSFKAFDVVIGDKEAEPTGGGTSVADDDIPF